MPAAPLPDYFTDLRLVQRLCRMRLNLARENRRRQFLAGLLGDVGLPSPGRLQRLLPPRKQWGRFNPTKAQRQQGVDKPALIAGNMARHVLVELGRPTPRYRWVGRLRELLDAVQSRGLGWSPGAPYSPSRVVPIPKGKPGNGQKYRIVTVYGLEESLLSAGFSAWLRDWSEPALKASAMAFRATPASGGPPPTHHDAVREIVEYRQGRSLSEPLWCAECDIQGFFDAVYHQSLWEGFHSFQDRVSQPVEPRVRSFLESFVSGYDYDDALTQAESSLAGRGITAPVFSRPRSAVLDLGWTEPEGEMGIPQGAFASCIFANLLLTEADEEVERALGGEGLYLRYCDDIVIVHPDRGRCAQALNVYLEALARLCLPYHPPVEVTRYGRGFWREKSKLPYRWAQDGNPHSVPWLAFVGYQVRRDGLVRIREASIQKELNKQRSAVDDYLKEINKRRSAASGPVRVRNLKNAEYRLMMHLLGIGVGYPSDRLPRPSPNAVSWTGGFQVLREFPHDDVGLRRLDAGRRRALDRFRIKTQGLRSAGVIEDDIKPGGLRPEWALRFDGKPFGYVERLRG